MLFGRRVRSSGYGYDSPAEAGRVLEEALTGATRIIEREPVSIGGEVVGERAVAIRPSGAVILRTERGALYTVEAPSVGLAAALEKYTAEESEGYLAD